jgi:ParB family chromosome partitioning protein
MTTAEVVSLPLAKVKRNPNQPRENFPSEHIESLANSIRERGLIQPISVRPIAGGMFQIVAGECRYRAHQLLNAPTIKAIVEDIDDQEMRLRAIVENVQRHDMDAIEEARGYQGLVDDGMAIAKIAKVLGIHEKRVTWKLSLLKLDEQVQHLVKNGYLQPRTATHLSRLATRDQLTIVKAIQSGKLSDNHWDVRAAVKKLEDCRADPAQAVLFNLAKPSSKDVKALRALEDKVSSITDMINAGFDDGECTAAARVDPNRLKTVADKLKLCKQHINQMEFSIRQQIAVMDGASIAGEA